MSDGPCPLQGEHLRVIIPPLSSLPMTVEPSSLLSVDCLVYNRPGVSIRKPKWLQLHLSRSLLKVAERRGVGATYFRKEKKEASVWATLLSAQIKVNILEFLATEQGKNNKCDEKHYRYIIKTDNPFTINLILIYFKNCTNTVTTDYIHYRLICWIIFRFLNYVFSLWIVLWIVQNHKMIPFKII